MQPGTEDHQSDRVSVDNSVVAETNKNIYQLVEINRALAQDLDLSRRMVAELSRECDEYRDELDKLRNKLLDGRPPVMNNARLERDRVQHELSIRERETEKMRGEMDFLSRDTAAARTRAEKAEERLELIMTEFESVVRERDDAMNELAESTAAMEEIKHRLSGGFATPTAALYNSLMR